MGIAVFFVIAVLIAGVAGICWLVLYVILTAVRLKRWAQADPAQAGPAQTQPDALPPATQITGAQMTADEEGYAHSGPHGYSPNTPYPETQYGSQFDPEAEWNHHEEGER